METLQIEKTYNAPITLVCKAIINRGMMKAWYFNFGEDFKPEPGAVFE